jgi:hypothetical protein
MSIRRQLLRPINAALRRAGARLVSARSFDLALAIEAHVDKPIKFRIGSLELPCFAHRINCGWPYLPSCTERTVELALADWWLYGRPADSVIEIGAVTPYYWPQRVQQVVDPTDTHPLVTIRKPIEQVSLQDRAVLSISTIEHIGIGDYGLPVDRRGAEKAMRKLMDEAREFLVTFPTGYNAALDEYVLKSRNLPADVGLRLLARRPSGVGWIEVAPVPSQVRPYGRRGLGVFVLIRGREFA